MQGRLTSKQYPDTSTVTYTYETTTSRLKSVTDALAQVKTYAYGKDDRLSGVTVQGAGAETFQYDAIGRLSVHANDLGSFTLGYLGQTNQIASRTLASSTLATTWSYLPNTGLTAGQFSSRPLVRID